MNTVHCESHVMTLLLHGNFTCIRCKVLDLGVVHNCHHFHERTQRTLGGGVKGDRTLFKMSFTVMEMK